MRHILQKWLALFVLLASIIGSFALFGNGIKGDFVFDDKIVIVGNPLIEEHRLPVSTIFTGAYHFTQPRTGLYRPLTIFSYALNARLFGFSPVSFHVVNIVFHALAVWLVFLVVRRLAGARAGLVALLPFLFFPIHVEAVTSIVGRAELLAFLFVLAALWASMRRWYWMSAISFLLALWSKESAIAFLPLWFAWAYWLDRQAFRHVAKRALWFIPPLAAYVVLRYVALGPYVLSNDATAVYNPLKFASFPATLWTSAKVAWLYLQKTVAPTWFSSDYSFNQTQVVTNPFASGGSLGGLAALALLAALAVWKRASPWGWAALAFLAPWFIVSNLVFKTGTVMAERLMYAPSFGLAFMAALGVAYLRKKYGHEKIIYGFLGALLIFYGYKTVDRNRDWLTEEHLYASALEVAPDSAVNQTNQAYLLYLKKDYAGAKTIAEAVLAKAPEHVPALNLAAQTNKKLGDPKIAEDLWKKAITLRPDYLRGYLGLGVLYYENGYFTSSEKALADAVAIYPRWTEVLYLSLARSALGKYDEAIDTVKRYYGESPSRPELKFALGMAQYKKGDRDAALTYLNQVKSPGMSLEEFLKTIAEKKIFLITDL